MYKILTASNDTYITNKYISNFRVKDANTGKAATIDLFKMYDETYSNDGSLIELSRGLLKFDLSEIADIDTNKCKMSDPSFSVTLNLFDVYGGQTTPDNFTLRLHPLSKSFDSGIGRDIIRYTDLGSANFITASISSGVIDTWNEEGANAKGLLDSENIDIITSGDLQDGNGVVNLYKDVTFTTGYENLSIDVTNIVSGTVAGLIPDCGFRLSYSDAIEDNQKTYFVKRFSSNDSKQHHLRPTLVVKYNDSLQDHREGFNFNMSGSLFINNVVNGAYSNIMSASTTSPGTLEQVSGNNCILLKVMTGSFSKYITGSNHAVGEIDKTGIYSASFLINRYDTDLYEHIIASGSITFDEVWTDMSENVLYKSSSFTINDDSISSFSNVTSKLLISVTNLRNSYDKNSIARFRVHIDNKDRVVSYVKLPVVAKSEVFYNVRYSITDVESQNETISFSKNDNSTLLSVDSDGLYFDIDMKSLHESRQYNVSFLVKDKDEEKVFSNIAKFKVVT